MTLDGHGQRHNHELLLNPSNALLVLRLGGNRMELLTDLFASSCGGPNVRAALAHGMWDEWIHEELTCLRSGLPWDDKRNDEELWNLIHLLWIVTNSNLDEDPFEYQPRYSYTTVTKQSVSGVVLAQQRLLRLLQTLEIYSAQKFATNATDVIHVQIGHPAMCGKNMQKMSSWWIAEQHGHCSTTSNACYAATVIH